MATEIHIFTRVLDGVNSALDTYISHTVESVISSISPTAKTLLAVYIMMWGWAMVRGMIEEPVMDTLNRFIKLSLVLGIALNIGLYNQFLRDWLWNTPDALASVISGDAQNSISFLDKLTGQIWDFGYSFYERAQTDSLMGIPSFSMLIPAFIIWTIGISVTGYAAFLLLLSKIGLGVVLGLGPIFVLLVMFEPTKRFFEAWVSQAINFVLVVVCAASVINIFLEILETYFGQIDVSTPQIINIVPVALLSLVSILTLIQVPTIASSLSGGISLGTLGAVNGLLNRAKGAAGAMRPTSVRRSINRARADIQISRGVASAGLTRAMRGAVGAGNMARRALRRK